MRIAVVSDIHDNIWNLEKALSDIEAHDLEALLFLGDFCAPFTLAQIGDNFSNEIHVVFGNNDGDQFLLTNVASNYPQFHLHGHLGEIQLGGRDIALNHYPDISRRLAESGAFDAVFSGHNHKRQLERIGDTLWANPGEVMGRFGEPSYGIYDTDTGSFEHTDIT
jgi:hypothetical protein